MIVDEELRATFRDEAAGALDELLRLRDGLAALDDAGASERLLVAYRIVHNIKGAARLTGLASVEPVAHAAEETIDALRKGRGRPTPGLIDLLARVLTGILRHVEGDATSEELHALAVELFGSESVPAAQAEGDAVRATAADELVRVRATHLDRLMSIAGEVVIENARRESMDARLEELAEAFREHVSSLPLERRGALQSLVGRLDVLLSDERAETQRAILVGRELADAVRAIRLVPLEGWVAAWRRIVDDAANEVGKRVRLEVDTGEIALDRRVLDGLRDPMVHLLRNAVDHGIERSTDRATLGKQVVGTIAIRARTVGSMVELEVRDDGRGIDTERLVARAIERGVIPEARARTLSRSEELDLAFSPGLSTASSVTNLSGRGIGLDVVRLRVTELGGRVELEAEPDVGTVFRLTLPANVVSTKGLVVRVGETRFAVPIVAVERTVRLASDAVRDVDGVAAVERPGAAPLRLRWLSGLLGDVAAATASHLFVVVVADGGSEVGLVVDEVCGEAEFVARTLPWNVRRVSGVTGATVLGDGSLALVLDVVDLVGRHVPEVVAVRRGEIRAAASKRILIADDSVTSRILQRNILSSAGYEVLVATDGLEALALLDTTTVDLVVTDVEMPRLDGIELTRRIRANPKTRSLPVIVVTSLSRPEDVAAGASAGADEYIVKGRFDHRTLLEAVARLA